MRTTGIRAHKIWNMDKEAIYQTETEKRSRCHTHTHTVLAARIQSPVAPNGNRCIIFLAHFVRKALNFFSYEREHSRSA